MLVLFLLEKYINTCTKLENLTIHRALMLTITTVTHSFKKYNQLNTLQRVIFCGVKFLWVYQNKLFSDVLNSHYGHYPHAFGWTQLVNIKHSKNREHSQNKTTTNISPCTILVYPVDDDDKCCCKWFNPDKLLLLLLMFLTL